MEGQEKKTDSKPAKTDYRKRKLERLDELGKKVTKLKGHLADDTKNITQQLAAYSSVVKKCEEDSEGLEETFEQLTKEPDRKRMEALSNDIKKYRVNLRRCNTYKESINKKLASMGTRVTTIEDDVQKTKNSVTQFGEVVLKDLKTVYMNPAFYRRATNQSGIYNYSRERTVYPSHDSIFQ